MSNNTKSWRVQITVAVIGLIGILGAAIFTNWDKLFPPETPSQSQSRVEEPLKPAGHEQRISTLHAEITYRLQEIRTFLYQGQMTNRNLYDGTKRFEAHGVGVSAEFKDAELRTLLFKLAQITPARNRSHVQDMSDLFEELVALAPPAPFTDGDLADPQKVESARSKFNQIEREWQRLE